MYAHTVKAAVQCSKVTIPKTLTEKDKGSSYKINISWKSYFVFRNAEFRWTSTRIPAANIFSQTNFLKLYFLFRNAQFQTEHSLSDRVCQKFLVYYWYQWLFKGCVDIWIKHLIMNIWFRIWVLGFMDGLLHIWIGFHLYVALDRWEDISWYLWWLLQLRRGQ